MHDLLRRTLAEAAPGGAPVHYRGLRLSSRFQAIFSLEARGAIGYEALLVARDGDGRSVAPPEVFEAAQRAGEVPYLDALARALHVGNFQRLATGSELLFLNVAPAAAVEEVREAAEFFPELLSHHGLAPARVVVEVLEDATGDEARLAEAIGCYRTMGCAVALDDFGEGSAKVERIWRLRPNFVKMARSLTHAAGRDERALHVLRGLVRIIQNCDCSVAMEGVETEAEARAALDSGAEYVQGYHFARPQEQPAGHAAGERILAELVPCCEVLGLGAGAHPERIAIHAEALQAVAMALETGSSFASAVELLLSLSGVMRGYLLAGDGRIVGASSRAEAFGGSSPAGAGVSTRRAGWRIRCLAGLAARTPGSVMFDGPASAASASPERFMLCCAFRQGSDTLALCAEVVA